jgi:hypothetical protein
MSLQRKALVKASGYIISFLIVITLILSGPAEAYVLNLSVDDRNVKPGDTITFSASLNIENGELFGINYLFLKLNGTNSSIECKFLPNGTILEGCPGIKIIQISSAPYGYGYNYGYGYGYGYGYQQGLLKYNITLDTKNYSVGKYDAYIGFASEDKTFEESGGIITIAYSGGGKQTRNGCYLSEGSSIINKNIRGTDGEFVFNGTLLGNDKLQLTIRSKGANRGSGYLNAQRDRTRFSYKFKVESVIEDYNKAYVQLSGTYRIGPTEKTELNATLVIDKKNSAASLDADNIHVENMDLIFNGKGC